MLCSVESDVWPFKNVSDSVATVLWWWMARAACSSGCAVCNSASSVAGLSSTQVFQGCLHIAEGFGHGWFQGGERREKQITHSPNCSHVVVSPVGALPVSAVSCLVCSAEIFREKVFMFSVGPSRLLLRCFYTRGQDESSAENFAFFLRKILSLTDSSKCGICTDQSDCKCFLAWLQSAHYDEAEPEFFHGSLNRL